MTTRNPRRTRERLLETAFEQIHAHGFQGMRVDEVLRASGLQKGAFYHHFGSKTELGYAVLEERVRPLVESLWIEPLSRVKDPVRDLPRLVDGLARRVPAAMREHGCPLNNLALEMASQDAGFRERTAALFARWIDAYEARFERARAEGQLRADLDCRAVAEFLVAAIEGCIGLSKADGSPRHWAACRSQLAAYLETLRPDGRLRASATGRSRGKSRARR